MTRLREKIYLKEMIVYWPGSEERSSKNKLWGWFYTAYTIQVYIHNFERLDILFRRKNFGLGVYG